MEIKFDFFNQMEKPSITLVNPERTQLFSLNACYDTQVKLRWNGQSEFLFSYPQHVDGIDLPAYDYLEGKREVLIERLGYFQIIDVVEDLDGIVGIKKVTCYSQDSELVYKKILHFTGTYSFNEIMSTVIGLAPEWSIGTIHNDLVNVYRTFDISDSNVYQFLTKDVVSAFNCFFVFGYFDKTISAYPINYPPLVTDIFLSFDNLIQNTKYTEITSEIATCLKCYGGNNLSIRYVNPLGTDSIYNFTYYKTIDWMDQDLIDAITVWENKLDGYKDLYAELVADLSESQTNLLTYQAELVDLETELAVYKEERAARLAQGLDVVDIDIKIDDVNLRISSKNTLITITKATVTSLTNRLANINNELSFKNPANFNGEQYGELQNFIYENTYENDNIIITESMTFPEIQSQSQQLYDMAQEILAKISMPRYQIEIESVNFLAIKEYEFFIEQLRMGDQITVDTGKGYYIDATCLEVDFSYDDPEEFTIILGNRQRLGDANFVFADLFSQRVTGGGTTVYGTTIESGGGTWVMVDLTGQTGTNFNTPQPYTAGTLDVYVNGVLQRKKYTYLENANLQSFIMLDEILDGDVLIVKYRLAS